MASIPKKVSERLSQGLKRFQPIIQAAKARDAGESDTVTIITDCLKRRSRPIRSNFMRILTFILCLLSVSAFAEVTEGEFAKIKELADKGDAGAQCDLGACYTKGEGVLKDLVEAVKWYRKSAEQGNAGAQFNLGVCYSEGEGVLKDKVEAVKWYRKSAEQGNAWAQFNLGYCYRNGDGVSKDLVEAVKWYRKSAEQGDARAQFNLGYCYNKGEGVLTDLVEAYAYYNLAGITSELGRENRDILEKEMTPSQIEAGVKRSKELQAQIAANIEAKSKK